MPPSESSRPATDRDLSAVEVGDVVDLTFSCDERAMATYADLSGDHNPLHHDDAYARARGFEGRVVYGGLLVAAISQLLGDRLPGHGCVWRSLDLQFHSPLYLNQTARVTARVSNVSVAVGAVDLHLNIHCGDRRIAKGRAQAMLATVRA
jgi:3-hydroxybutyryl-CoA dehydratase